MNTKSPDFQQIRRDGAMAALDRVHPLCNPYLTGPDRAKNAWLLGYSFAQKLSELDKAKLRVELLKLAEER